MPYCHAWPLLETQSRCRLTDDIMRQKKKPGYRAAVAVVHKVEMDIPWCESHKAVGQEAVMNKNIIPPFMKGYGLHRDKCHIEKCLWHLRHLICVS